MRRDEAFPPGKPDSRPPEMGDQVVEKLLELGVVNEKQVETAAALRIQMYHKADLQPAWRWLAWGIGVDRDAIYRVAGEVYDYKRFEISPSLLKSFIRRIQPCFSLQQWRRLGELGVVPVRGIASKGGSRLWSFAAYDPTSRHVHDAVRQCVGRDYFLYQADRESIVSLITEAMIASMELPRWRRKKGNG